jgi:uncharacterized membrane protein
MNRFTLISIICLSLGACATARDDRMAQGAMIGGTGGAIIGGVASGNVGGAVVGGVTGAAIGAVGADMTRPRHGNKHCYFSEAQQREICNYR